ITGPDQHVRSNTPLTLDGRLSYDDDGDELTYNWSQIAGRTVTLNNANSAIATFTSPSPSSNIVLQFQLQVTDPGGLSDSSTMLVNVARKTKDNAAETASGGTGPLFLLGLVLVGLLRRLPLDYRLSARGPR
ncbi:MAG: hypothetical protein OEM25_05515, partial [Gammaproteobacteria bacterium]|nr:hypothetical protein [Gammaproteobacteria bacterium]